MVTIEEAEAIVKNVRNGVLEGKNTSKGGRAWLMGEWQLFELEALCFVLRHEAGTAADGLEERLADWKHMDEFDVDNLEPDSLATNSTVLNLEIGKTYRDCDGYRCKIIGGITESGAAYDLGYRFYDEHYLEYKPNGECSNGEKFLIEEI